MARTTGIFRSPTKNEEKLDLAARAAWLYYVGGKTQNEVAEKLRISRTSAQRLVVRAFERGLVKVRVHHKIGECLEAAQTLSQRFNLTFCDVVPSDSDDYDYALREMAVAGAQLVESYLESRKPLVIGMSIGRTIQAVINELTAFSRPQHRFVCLVGTIARDGSSNPYDVALHAAEKTGSKCFLLAAPLFADSVEERDQWRQNRSYRVVETLSRQTDVTFVGIGEIGPGCPLQRDGFVSRKNVEELTQAGVVGEIMGWAFGETGEEIRAWTYERVTSIPLLRPPKRPVIAFAGGKRKTKAVLAALRGRWINGLVTDENCAERILASEA